MLEDWSAIFSVLAILETPASDGGALRDLTQLASFRLLWARKWLIRKGEMSEWLKEHAWKANSPSNTEQRRDTLSHSHSASYPSRTITQCASVNLHVDRGFEGHVSQSFTIGIVS